MLIDANTIRQMIGFEQATQTDAVAPEYEETWAKLGWSPFPRQQRMIDAHRDGVYATLFGGAAGPGKALKFDTPIATPDGWSTIAALRTGDTIFDENGAPCRVTWKSPIFRDRPTYEIEFDDGHIIVADGAHEWLTFTSDERTQMHRRSEHFRARRRATRPSRATGGQRFAYMVERNKFNNPAVALILDAPTGTIRTTEEISTSLESRPGRLNHAVQIAAPLQLPDNDFLPIAPYTLGAWLGDGTSATGAITSADQLVIDRIVSEGFRVQKQTAKYLWRIKGLTTKLASLGLLRNKHIPLRYLRASPAQRLELLRGLLDTDGHVDRDGGVELQLTNLRLLSDARLLVESLGIRAKVTEGRATLYGKDCGPKWRLKFTTRQRVVTLPRKAFRLPQSERATQRWRYITRVTRVDAASTQCIEVDSPSHLFLAGHGLIPTHNSSAGRHLAIAFCRKYPGVRVAIFRRTYPELHRTHEVPVRMLPSEFGRYYSDPHEFQFSNGSILELASCERDADMIQFQSAEFQGLVIDEATQFTWYQIRFLNARVRSVVPNVPKFLLLLTNPGGESHAEIKSTFVDPEEPETEFIARVGGDEGAAAAEFRAIFIPAKLDDNPALLANDPDYRTRLQALPENLRRAWMEGSWDLYEGMALDRWARVKHTVKPFEIPRSWPRWMGLDYGYNAPMVALWLTRSPEGITYVYRELWLRQTIDREQARIILDLSKDDPPIRFRAADPSVFSKQPNGISIAQAWLNAGMRVIPANNDRRAGLQRVQDYLFWDEDHPPRLQIFTTCRDLISSLPTLRYDKYKPDDIDTDGNDHGFDALKYGLQGGSLTNRSARLLDFEVVA